MIYVGIVLVFLVLVLAIPFEFVFIVYRQRETRADFSILWLFGVVRVPVSNKTARQRFKKPSKTKKPRKHKSKSANFATVSDLFRNARFRYRLIRFVKDVFKTIHIASFYLRVRLGLDDPADTGRIWAYLGPLAVFLTNLSNATVSLEPDFQTEILLYESSGRIRVIPLQVIVTVLAFVFSPVTIQAFWRMRKAGKQ